MLAIGGGAVGLFACGGAALGFVARGGGAFGYYACGGGAVGKYALSALRQDSQAVQFFESWIRGLTYFKSEW